MLNETELTLAGQDVDFFPGLINIYKQTFL